MNISPPIPENESFRLERLKYYSILDTEKEEMFDNLTELASDILGVSSCMVTLVDENRQWFKSNSGSNVKDTPRNISFCQYAIMGEEVFEIQDTLEDDRFKNNPLVIADPRIRFYAGAPLVDMEGAAIGALCAIDSIPKNLTNEKRKIMELISKTLMNLIRLRREKFEIEKLSSIKDEFLSNMSHEIRTPLNAIIGFNDVLKKTVLTKEQLDYLDIIAVSSQNLKVIINDILDVSKLESGNVILEKTPISLHKLIHHVINLQAQIAKEKGVKLISTIDNEIPNYVLGDETRLIQIFINLISNAIKFTNKGSVELRAIVDFIKETKVKVSFTVKDTGIGIPKDKLDSIFERFSQAETSTTRFYGGTGLGLSIVSMLVRLYKGKINVLSSVGKGSEFTFNIVFDMPKVASNTEIVLPVVTEDKEVLANLSILLVEDNIHNQILAKTYLSRWGASIDVAENGQVALDVITDNSYDLILMDLQMPVLDGFATTEKMREDLKINIPIIACSAHSLVGEKEKCIAMGMVDYITKPYTEQDLIKTVLKYKNVSSDSEFNREVKFDDFKEIIKRLKIKEGEDFVNEITGYFLERTPQDILDIKEAIASNNLEALKEKVHLIMGTFGVFHFDKGRILCSTIEKEVQVANSVKIKKTSNDLVCFLEKAMIALSS